MSTDAQFPQVVLIIRHGEKPGDPNGDDGGPNLSVLGSARAAALPSLFIPDPATSPTVGPQLTCDLLTGFQSEFGGKYGDSQLKGGKPRFSTPNFLFATKPSHSSSRPVETITPTAQALQFLNNDPTLKIHQKFTNDEKGVGDLATEILQNPKTYGNQVVLICWHHGMIPDLIKAFKVQACQLPPSWTKGKWPGTVFDLVFSITWPSNQAQLSVAPQQLLYGDSATAPDLGTC